MQDTLFHSWVGKIPWRRDRLPTPVFLGFPGGSASKESPCNAGDLGLIPGLGRTPGGGHGNPLQYSCQEDSPGAWWASILRVANNQTQLSIAYLWFFLDYQISVFRILYVHSSKPRNFRGGAEFTIQECNTLDCGLFQDLRQLGLSRIRKKLLCPT